MWYCAYIYLSSLYELKALLAAGIVVYLHARRAYNNLFITFSIDAIAVLIIGFFAVLTGG